MSTVIRLPKGMQRDLNEALRSLLTPKSSRAIDFSGPRGEEALVPPTSVSWRVFKNPVALFIGGVAAVLLELAEPSVRAGVWNHTSFRRDPLNRLQRTGLAAMTTVYAARSVAGQLIGRVARIHTKITGETADGIAYAANDPRLLAWVHTTAAFTLAHAYSRYVEPLTLPQMDQLYHEGTVASRLYGVIDAPTSSREVDSVFKSTGALLRPSPILFEFLTIMHEMVAFPPALVWIQPLLVRAAIEIVPDHIRHLLGLTEDLGLRRRDRWFVKLAANLANRIVLAESPAAQSCVRLGLPPTYLYV